MGARAAERGRRVTAEANCGPFPVWGAAGWGQAQGHAAPSHRLDPGAGSELPPACVYETACVFLCGLREEGQEAHLFLIPQKALLPGPGGAGLPVEDCEGRRGRVSGHTHTVWVGYNVVWCGCAYVTATPPLLPFVSACVACTFSQCTPVLTKVVEYLLLNSSTFALFLTVTQFAQHKVWKQAESAGLTHLELTE